MTKRLLHGLLIGLTCAAIALGVAALRGLTWFENVTWDLRARLMARPAAACPDIRLVFLDQTALDYESRVNSLRWPWYRQVYADGILAFCRRTAPRAVVFDWLFSEPSMYGVEDDVAFANGISVTTGFVASAFFSSEQGLLEKLPDEYVLRTPTVGGLAAWQSTDRGRALAVRRASLPLAMLATNASLVGNISGALSDDAVIRRTVPFRVFDGRVFPSLGLAAYLVAHPGAPLRLTDAGLEVDGRTIPMDRQGQVILRYRGPSQTHRVVSAHAVLNSEARLQEGGGKAPEVNPEFFKGAYVFFGPTAPALFDLKASPTAKVYPGVEVHATFLDNLLAGDFIRPTGWAAGAVLALLLGVVAGTAGRLGRTGWQTALAFVLCLPLPLAGGFIAYARGYWLEIAPASLAAVLALISATILNYAIEGRQKRFIKGAFKQYLSPVVIDRLVKNPQSLHLGGENRELTIFFSDIKGFTGISEKLRPEELTALLNEYLTAMTDIIMEEGGTVDKYIGDAIVAFWNAPLDQADHPERGVRAALRCQRKLAEMRPALAQKFGHELYVRIGVNTGPVVVGNMGSDQRFNFTFLGDAGNLASRLEGVNKQFGTYRLISEMTRARLGDAFAARELACIRVVGRAEPVRVFEPMFKEEYAARAAVLEPFAAALAMYYKGEFTEAARHFAELSDRDAAAKILASRCTGLAKEPPPTWDGVWEMKEK